MTYLSDQLDQITGSGGQIKIQIKNAEAATKWINIDMDTLLSIEELLLASEEPQEERVIFRKFPHDGAVIALFPDQYNERNGNIGSYMELGQHAETAPHFGDTKPAEPYEYHALQQELVRQGYHNLKVVKRFGKLGRK